MLRESNLMISRIGLRIEPSGQVSLELLCECGLADCKEVIRSTVGQFTKCQASGLLALAPGHTDATEIKH